MVRFEITTDVDRPVDEVFAYATDPARIPEWVSAIIEIKDADPPGLGAKATQVVKFLGRRFEFTSEVVEWEPNRKWAQTASKPFPIKNSLTFTPRGNGTRLDAVLEGEVGTFFKVGEPIVTAMAKRQFASDYANLKELLEAGIATQGKAEEKAKA
jgi:uncharacterized protein YndB with AHSA1/START domain